jgi:hypothetical protein
VVRNAAGAFAHRFCLTGWSVGLKYRGHFDVKPCRSLRLIDRWVKSRVELVDSRLSLSLSWQQVVDLTAIFLKASAHGAAPASPVSEDILTIFSLAPGDHVTKANHLEKGVKFFWALAIPAFPNHQDVSC